MATITIQVPLNTWQHFKHQYFPKVLKAMFPVEYEEHKFETALTLREVMGR